MRRRLNQAAIRAYYQAVAWLRPGRPTQQRLPWSGKDESMGLTFDIIAGRASRYYTCDRCGHPILDTPRVDPPAGARDYERVTHPGACPDDEQTTGE